MNLKPELLSADRLIGATWVHRAPCLPAMKVESRGRYGLRCSDFLEGIPGRPRECTRVSVALGRHH